MKWTKVALVVAIPALALLLLGGTMRSPTAEAKPTKIITITKTFCLTLTAQEGNWDGYGMPNTESDKAIALSTCNSLDQESSLRSLTAIMRGKKGTEGTEWGNDPKPEEFAVVDMDAGQLHESDGRMFFLAFDNNDSPMAFYADEGTFDITGTATVACGPGGVPGGADFQFQDEDCDGDGVKGDGVAVAKLTPIGGDRGPATVTVRQGMLEMEEPYTIVGEPRHISLKVVEPTIQTDAPDCVMFSAETIGEVLGSPERTILIATVTDDDGTPITGALVATEVDDPDKATFALAPPAAPVVPSLDLQSLGLGSPNVLCGGEDPGKVTITAKLTSGTAELGISLDGGAVAKTTKGEATVQAGPTVMVLTADPPSLVCDGINSSTVSATLTDAAGNPAVDGNRVRFEVKALGNADPINATTAGGKATTTVRPLSGITGGVPVRATLILPEFVPSDEPTPTPWAETTIQPTPTPAGEVVFEPSKVEASLLIPCSEAAPAGPAAPGAQPVPAIAPPATGDGGYLSDSQATSWGLPLALSAAVLFLVGGLALRRRAI